MATGETKSITTDVVFTSKYQLTTNDDTLIIRGATVTLDAPQGEIFTREGNDTVTIDDSVIVTDKEDLMFFLGSGDDTLTVRNTTLSAPVSTGSGDDTVIMEGLMQNKIRLTKELSFGTGNDLLELVSILENASSIDFGSSGIKTLRFNGGVLVPVEITGSTYGAIGKFTDLEVMLSGGTTGSNLELSGEQTNIVLNGNFYANKNSDFPKTKQTVSVFGGTTTLSVGDNIRTTVSLLLNNANLIQTQGGTLEFSYCDITADDSSIFLHDIVVKNGALSGNNTTLKIENSDFSNGICGIELTGGIIDFCDIGMVNCSACALSLSGTKATGSKLSLAGNSSYLGTMVTSGANVTIVDFQAVNNSKGGVISQNDGVVSLTSAIISGNNAYDFGGIIVQNGGVMTLTSASFSDNIASANSGGCGAVYLSGAVANMENTTFANNVAKGYRYYSYSSTAYHYTTSTLHYSHISGGAIYLDQSTLNYSVTSGAKITNTGNNVSADSAYGGWLYLNNGTANITVETGGILTIGKTGTNDDSIDGHGNITKTGNGSMLINSPINGMRGIEWNIMEGTLELAGLTREILLDNWTIGSTGKLILSELNDTIYMKMSKKIGTIDLGGGTDFIKTSGCALTDGMILFSDLTVEGGGQIETKLKNRTTNKGSTLRLNGCTLNSDFTGNNYVDSILINEESFLNGAIDMGGGNNVITATAQAVFTNLIKAGTGNDTLTLNDNTTISGEIDLGRGVNSIHVNNSLTADKIKITQGGKTTVYVYLGSTLTDNALTVYSDKNADRDNITLNWSEQTDLNKVRILVSRDSSSFKDDQYEFAVELYNKSKSFTLNLQRGYYIQFQAQDEDGWKQRMVDDHVAPDQVTGVVFDGTALTWNEANDNLGGNGIKQYHVEMASDASFSNILKSEVITGTKISLPELPETILYFRVNAEDYNDNISEWSESVSTVIDNTPPNSPANGVASVNGYSVTLSWSVSMDEGSGVSNYEYRVARDSSFNQIITKGTTEDCAITIDTLSYGTYFWQVRAKDASENIGEWSQSKSFMTIDSIAPNRPTNLDVTLKNGHILTAVWNTAKDDFRGSGLKGYEIQLADDAAFSNILKSLSVTTAEATIENLSNGTYYLRVRSIDKVGNESDWTDAVNFSIDKDTTLPTVTDVKADITVPTRQNVVVTASFNDDVELAQSLYRIGTSGAWNNYNGGVTVTENATVYFKAVDTSGNESAEVSYKVTNIDKTKPVITLDGNTQTPVQQTTLTAATDDGSAILYRINNSGEWTAYKGTITVSSNATYSFKATDEAGNTETAEITFNNIDTDVPIISNVQADTTEPDSDIVTVTAKFSDNLGLAQSLYRIGETGEWHPYVNGVTVSENTTVYFKAIDTAGNESEIASYAVTNIGHNQDNVISGIVSQYVEVLGPDCVYVDTTILSGGVMIISSGGVANNTTVNSRGYLAVLFGGTANSTIVSSDVRLVVEPGGAANNTIIYSGGILEVQSGGFASDIAADSGAHLSFTIAPNTFIAGTSAGSIFEIKDGQIIGYTIENGDIIVSSGGTANNTTVKADGTMGVYSDGTANNNIVDADGMLYVSSGGIAINTTVNRGGTVSVAPGATALEIKENGGFVNVMDGANVTFTPNILSGLVLSHISTHNYNEGIATIHSGTTANDVIISGGALLVYSGGIATCATINAGFLSVHSGGIANSTTVNSGGEFSIGSGGKLTGRTALTTGAHVSAASGAIFDFDISNLAPDAAVRIDRLSGITGWSDAVYMLTVSASQTNGIYKLADGASGFNKTISVQNTSGKSIGTLTVGQSTKIDGIDYSLESSDGTLALTISEAKPVSDVSPLLQTWETVIGATEYVVEYSTDNFEHVIQMVVDSNSLDSFQMPAGNYQMRVKADDGEWTVATPVVAEETNNEPKLIKSNADGHADVFFVNTVGTWESGYVAKHVGSTADTWDGTNEYVALLGKNKLADIIEGSTDANILLMTDDDNGDTLFVDDIYTASPGNMAEQQARIAQIDEIRAGAGNDIVDMTSQQFEYIGDGLTIRGGEGNDTIWANKGDNWLFGDAGNDRIVGASGEDVIVGGIGNDRMHGGGGNDVFTFCDNWGTDTVEQLVGGSVTLWFTSGEESNWDASSLTYTDGTNSVTVKGVTADQITLKFGDDGSDQFAMLSGMGAFFDATTERIFEESGKGILASL